MGFGLTALALLILLGFLFWMVLQYNRSYQPSAFAEAIRLGLERQRAGDFDGALAHFNRAIYSEPANKMGYVYRGHVHQLKHRADSAIGDFTEALAIDAHLASAYLARGQARLSKGDWQRALEDFNATIRLDHRQTRGAAYSNRAQLYLHQGQLDHALADANRAVKLARRQHLGYTTRGEIRLVMGDHTAALNDFRRALRYHPRSTFALAGLAISHHALGHTHEARWLWRQLVERDPRYQNNNTLREDYGCTSVFIQAAQQLIETLEL